MVQGVLVIMGPTASGKSALAMRYAAHLKRRGASPAIVSMDSAQVYRDMNIGTAKPSAQEQQDIEHHLIDMVAPHEGYSAARFAADARQVVSALLRHGRQPIVVGGTMLYARAWLLGLHDLPQASTDLREAIAREAQSKGWPALHAELTRVDPQRAAQLECTDAQRIGRALEIFRASGQPMSAWLNRPKAVSDPGFTVPWHLVSVEPKDRAWLHARIESRFDAMLRAGLIDELARLRQRYPLARDLPSMRSVGYRQTWAYLEGEIDRQTLRDTGIAATRQLAKRQITWLRSTARTVIDAQIDPQTQLDALLRVESQGTRA
jgi:tRNA dimethylallyltransferase